MLADRRSLLAGLAALPAAGLPLLPPSAAGRPDPFAACLDEARAANARVCTARGDAEAERHMGRMAEIDAAVMALSPTTLAEAASALAYARREHLQFALLDDPESGDLGDRLVLHLIDGALAVLRPFAGGGAA